jgi:hypothetical protein
MKWEKAAFLAERAENLAIVHLTRRDDLIVKRWSQPGAGDSSLDLLVTLTVKGRDTGRVFGVTAKGVDSYRRIKRVSSGADEIRFDPKDMLTPEDVPFPVCLFVFVMEDDAGYYKWIVKPDYGRDHKSVLRLNRTDLLKRLCRESSASIDEIVEQVNGWYENKIKIPA